MGYADKLKDRRWQQKRLEILAAANWLCESPACGTPGTDSTLHVHHRLYLRGRDPWEYEHWAYQVLCEDCHKAEQTVMEKSGIATAKFHFLMNACAAICEMDAELAQRLSESISTVTFYGPEQIASVLDLLDGIDSIMAATLRACCSVKIHG